MTRGPWVAALFVLLLLSTAEAALAQEATPPDSTAASPAAPDSVMEAAPALEAAPETPAEPPREEAAEPAPAEPPNDERLDRDRFEWGVAAVPGYFDWIGTFGYRRFLREGGPFQQNVSVEIAGAKKGYLSEGAVSLLYLFRPLRTVRPGWRIRPLLEFGPGGHLVIQVADVAGFDDTGFHTNVYAKMHAYAGLEALISRRWGILVRGRFTFPADRPLDYAQAAVFLR